MKCPHCHHELPDDSVFCMVCGKPTTLTAPASPAASAYETAPVNTKKRKKWLPFAIIGVVIMIAAIVLILMLTGRKSMPQNGVSNVLENGNFTVELNMMGEKMELQVDIDWKKEDVTVYAEQDGEFLFAIYDGYFIEKWYSSYTNSYEIYTENIRSEIAFIFANYNPDDEINWEDLSYTISKFLLNRETAVEDYVNVEEFADCVETLLNKLENKSWLKDHAGYSTEKKDGVTLHIYKPDLADLANAVLDILEPCIEDDDLYDYITDLLDNCEDMLDNIKITLTFGVKKDYLVSAEVKFMGMKYKVAIEDIGSTRIDTDELEALLKEARN